MRIVVAECSVLYSGRGDTTMGRAIRSIMIKNDGAISIHNDVGNKPLNYMGKDNISTETINEDDGTTIWRFDTRKEYLEITLYSVLTDFQHELDNGSVPLVRDGTEHDLQAWLFENHYVIREGLKPLQREYQTTAGAIDLMFEKPDGKLLGVEVKRVAMLGAVDQCVRYRNALNDLHDDVEVILTALDIRPNTAKQADKRKIGYTFVPSSWRTDNKEEIAKELDNLSSLPKSEDTLF